MFAKDTKCSKGKLVNYSYSNKCTRAPFWCVYIKK